MKCVLLAFLLMSMTSCASLYPIGGAIVGGGVGSLGGPAGAAVGAGAGAAGGQLLAKEKDIKDLKEEVDAYSKGDVEKRVQLRLEEARDGGFFSGMLEGVYDFIKLIVVILIIWNVLPIVYTFLSNKKINKKLNGGSNGKAATDNKMVQRADEKG